MDTDFEKLKAETEADLDRELDADEQHYLKGLLYFGKGCKLKAELDAGAEHIRPIAERVLAEIKDRRRDHRRNVMVAVGEFLKGTSKSTKRRIQKPRETNLFSRTER